MVVNDNAENLTSRGALWFFASKLAPTGDRCKQKCPALGGAFLCSML